MYESETSVGMSRDNDIFVKLPRNVTVRLPIIGAEIAKPGNAFIMLSLSILCDSFSSVSG